MKLKKTAMIKKLAFAICLISIVSCDPSDDDGNNVTNNNFSYLPLNTNNSWDYDVKIGADSSVEGLTVSSVSGNEYTLTANPNPPSGIMTGILSSGTLRATAGKLIGNGTVDFGIQGLDNLTLEITDGILYDQNANPDTELYTTSGTSTQIIQAYDLDISYEITTVQLASVAQMNVNGTNYTDVIHSQLIINAAIGTVILVPIPLLSAQDVIVIDNYWAKDVGLIKSDTQLDYTLEDLSFLGAVLPVPQSASILTEQDLTAYSIN
ncbi:MAG: hypothetical protein ACJAXY_001001 [Nonlabens sp.]